MVEWDEATCRRYAAGMDAIAARDHWAAARGIAARVGSLPRGAVIAEVASGPAHLLLELGHLFPDAELVALDREPTMLRMVDETARKAGRPLRTVATPAEAPLSFTRWARTDGASVLTSSGRT